MQLVQRLDEYGKPAWITLMILGFIIFWPIGLAILGYMIWSDRMGCSKNYKRRSHRWQGEPGENDNTARSGISRAMRAWKRHAPVSGNRAFDEYRAQTISRLEEEFDEFEGFLEQLRAARDKKEFDAFMASRDKPADVDDRLPPEGKDRENEADRPVV
jgi:hypothetical protein